jgi:extradiol dioxygenase family protein
MQHEYVVLTMDGNTNVYGLKFGGSSDEAVVVELFATNPQAAGASELGAGTIHEAKNARVITQRHFNAAFLMDSDESLAEEDATATLNELRLRYPIDAEDWSPVKK